MARQTIDKVRRNHALEHATVARLLDRGARSPMGGYSVASGFFIWGRVSRHEVAEAAEEALRLLNAGHKDLAISPYCGTNIMAAVVIGGLASTIVSGRKRGFWSNVRGAAAGLIAASLLGRPVGKLLQRRFTTLAEVSDLDVGTVRMLVKGPIGLIWVGTTSS